MSFETMIIDKISPMLATGSAEFDNGSLFLENVSEDIGRKVFHVLADTMGLGKVNVSVYTQINGFTYDFVA